MEVPKKITKCLKCGNEIRFPAQGHIHFMCPHCNNRFEYNNGEPVITEVIKKPTDPEKTSPKKGVEKKSKRQSSILIILLLLAFVGLVIYLLIPRNSISDSQGSSTPTVTTETDSIAAPITYSPLDTSPPFNVTRGVTYTDHSDVDSLLEEKLKDFAKDLGKHLLEELMKEMEKDTENGQWEKANDLFERTVDAMKKGEKKGKDLMKKNEAKLAKLKNDIIKQNPNKNELPDSKASDESGAEKNKATDGVMNNTPYSLTLYYTGPVSRIVTIPPGAVSNVKLPKGTYRIVAKVDNPNVREYYGTQTFGGYDYSVEYYIQTKFR